MNLNNTTILSDAQIDDLEEEFRRQFIMSHPGLMLNLSMLCATVKALRAVVYVPTGLPDDEPRTYQEEAERLLRDKLTLKDQLATVTQERDEERRLRAELKQIAQTGISEVSSVGAALKDTALIDFRHRAVQLVKRQAEAWLAGSRREVSDERSNMMYERCTAARQLAEELEKLE